MAIDMEATTVKTYRLIIPLTVEAELVTPETVKWIAEWCKGKVLSDGGGVMVPTLHGVEQALLNMYVVKKMSGDFKVINREFFESKYVLLDMGQQ
jgi:hypothetical protein